MILSFFLSSLYSFFFFFNDTATTEIYTLSLHDALPISVRSYSATNRLSGPTPDTPVMVQSQMRRSPEAWVTRSEEHTSELQSQSKLVCRLLLEKKKNQMKAHLHAILVRSVAHSHSRMLA